MTRIKSPQDFWSGLLFLTVGIAAAWFGRVYIFGTATKMGPGYLPTVLSWGLAAIGAFLIVRALFENGPPIERSMVRPQAFILAAIIVFALSIERFGLAPAVILVTLVASFASREIRWSEVAILAAGLAIGCSLLFIRLLGQPLAVWNWGY